MIYIRVIIVLAKNRREHFEQNKKGSLVETTIKGSIIILPLLGLTWVFGFLTVDRNTTLFAWIFTILNSLQGAAILFLHVIRNEKVLKYLKPVRQKLKGNSNHPDQKMHTKEYLKIANTTTLSDAKTTSFTDNKPVLIEKDPELFGNENEFKVKIDSELADDKRFISQQGSNGGVSNELPPAQDTVVEINDGVLSKEVGLIMINQLEAISNEVESSDSEQRDEEQHTNEVKVGDEVPLIELGLTGNHDEFLNQEVSIEVPYNEMQELIDDEFPLSTNEEMITSQVLSDNHEVQELTAIKHTVNSNVDLLVEVESSDEQSEQSHTQFQAIEEYMSDKNDL